MKVIIPPIKSQGIKSKLVPWIKTLIPDEFDGVWVEPFMGTGVVAFNLAPRRALLCDTNPHLVSFYQGIQSGNITSNIVREYLETEGRQLLNDGEDHYYKIRDRFNLQHNPLDFLFVNRAGFNGMIRFNKKGGFNIPFCRKPSRFAPAYVTKIVNQVSVVSKILETKEFIFKCQSYEQTINSAAKNDILYCDPPYIDRHADYFNGWSDCDERSLCQNLSASPAKFILSTWHHDDFRANQYVGTLWAKFNILTRDHFYHVGGSEDNRNPMVEAIVTNLAIDSLKPECLPDSKLELLDLFAV